MDLQLVNMDLQLVGSTFVEGKKKQENLENKTLKQWRGPARNSTHISLLPGIQSACRDMLLFQDTFCKIEINFFFYYF
jgi:hypothetical protein